MSASAPGDRGDGGGWHGNPDARWPFVGVVMGGDRPWCLAFVLAPTHAVTAWSGDEKFWSDAVLRVGAAEVQFAPIEFGDPDEDFGVGTILEFDEPLPILPDAIPPIVDVVEGVACRSLEVRDDLAYLEVRDGTVTAVATATGRFTVRGGRLPDDRTTTGSPVVVDGGVCGIIGTGGTNAFGHQFLRAASRQLALPEWPAFELGRLSPTARGSFSYAYALHSWRTHPEPDPAAVIVAGSVAYAASAAAKEETVLTSFVDAIARANDASMTRSSLLARIVDQPATTTLGDASVLTIDPPLTSIFEAAREYSERFEDATVIRPRHILAAAVKAPERLSAVVGVEPAELRRILLRVIPEVDPSAPMSIWNEIVLEDPFLGGRVATDLVDPTKPIPLENDQLGMADYVRMLATVIARENTPLPVSVGLFGAWGSGKSFFMGMLRSEIEELARSEIEELAPSDGGTYCSHIKQIGFNAWHYSDANLWASLGDEIFRQLAEPVATGEELSAELLTELDVQRGRRKELMEATKQAERAAADLRASLDLAAVERTASVRGLMVSALKSSVVGAEWRKAWKSLGIDGDNDEEERTRLLSEALTGTSADLTDLHDKLRAPSTRLAVVVSAVVLIVAVVLGFVAPQIRLIVGGLGLPAILASFTAALNTLRSGARKVTDLAGELRKSGEKELAAAVKEVHLAEAHQLGLEAQLANVIERVGEINRELAMLAPGQRLYQFIADRNASDDYRSQLGLITIIRKDFEQLARLLKESKRKVAGADVPGDRRPPERIVLYIDDLDRCSPTQVVEVLQAVHLLLALDLFVVVVGVDPRWLVKSLDNQYRTALDRAETADDTWWDATPDDYLEKIFNIPFVLPAMEPAGFENLIRQMATSIVSDSEAEAEADRSDRDSALGSDAGTGVETGSDAEAASDLDSDAAADIASGRAEPDSQFGADSADVADSNGLSVEPRSEVANLRDRTRGRPQAQGLTESELTMLKAVATLVESPRSAKRLLNLYGMLRSTRNLSPASRFLGTEDRPGEYQAVVVLLGMLTAHPELLGRVLMEPPLPTREETGVNGAPIEIAGHDGGILYWPQQRRWRDVTESIKPSEDLTHNGFGPIGARELVDWQHLDRGLRASTDLVKLDDLEAFRLWGPRIARFSFKLSPLASGGSPWNDERLEGTSSRVSSAS